MVRISSPARRAVIVLAIVLIGTLVLGFVEARAGDILSLYGQENVGTAGAQFLRIPVGARSSALGQAGVAAATDGSGLFWNPATIMHTSTRRGMFFGHTAYTADIEIEHAAYFTRWQNWGLGLTAGVLRSGDIPRTTEFHQEGTGQSFNANMLVLGLTATRSMTDRFAMGGTLKLYQENLDDVSIRSVLVDVGVLYFVGVGDMRIGFAVKNFGPDLKPSGTPPESSGFNTPGSYQSFSAPTSGSFGAAYTWGLSRNITLLTTADFHHPADYSESFRFGSELGLGGTLLLRGGFETNRDVGGMSAGFGVAVGRDHWNITVDYALRDMGAFGTVHMMSVDIMPMLTGRRSR